jgi:hypothetical protein
MIQSTIAVGETHFLLAQGHDVDELKRRIETAVHAGGAFVDFVVVGNRTVSIFMTDREPIVLTEATVVFDDRDTGDPHDPFGGHFDPR